MKFSVHALELHRDIPHPGSMPAVDGTLAVFCYTSAVRDNNLEPEDTEHLTGDCKTETIKAGRYLFTQGILLPRSDMAMPVEQKYTEQFREGAKQVWLESLWRELTFKNDKILVRILSEDGHDIFQIFREIEKDD